MMEIFYTSDLDNQIFIIDGEKSWTYKEIKTLIAGEIEKIKPLKKNIVLTGDDNFDFIIKFFASIFSGKTIYLLSDVQKLKEISEDYDYLTDKNYDFIENYIFPKVNPQEVIINFYTSGSSGTPKNIKKNLLNLLKEGEDVARELQIVGKKRFVTASTTTMCHLFGMTFHLMFSIANRNVINTKTQIYPDKYDIENSILISTPTVLDVMQKYEIKPIVPPKYIFSAGSKLSDKTFEYLNTFSNVIEIYGSTETGVIGYKTDCKDKRFQKFKNVEIFPKKDGAEIVSNYAFEGKTEISDNLEITKEGILIKCRTDRVLKIYEKRISAPELEENIKKNPLCDDAYMLKIGEKLACFVVLTEQGEDFLLKNGIPALIKKFKSYLKEYSSVIPQKWKFWNEIPKNRFGKVDANYIEHIFDLKFSMPVILSAKRQDDSIIYNILFHKNCKFFVGHFDNFPIVPGVVQLYLAKEFANRYYGIEIEQGQWKRIKFSNIIQSDSVVSLRLTKTEKYLSWEYFSEEKNYSSGVFSCDNVFKEQEA